MLKKTLFVLGVCSLAMLLSLAGTAGWLVWQGEIQLDRLDEAYSALRGENLAQEQPEELKEIILPSQSDVVRERSLNVLSLSTQADTLRTLKDMLSSRAAKIARARKEIADREKLLDARIADLEKQYADEATTQARGIIAAMKPNDAIASLSELEKEETVRIVSGLPDETIAKLLKAFLAGTAEQAQRGREIFDAIQKGKPKQDMLDAVRNGAQEEAE